MKKYLLILGVVMLGVLSGCTNYDYNDFDKDQLDSHLQAESKNEDFYMVYYYSDSCVYCDDVKQDILTFMDGFKEANVYLLNVDNAEDDSTLNQYEGTPTLLVFRNGSVVETFKNKTGIENFIFQYSDFDIDDLDELLDYSMFDHIASFDDVEDQTESEYYVYFYHPDCSFCKRIVDDVLEYAYEMPDGIKVYFLSGEGLANYANPYSITGTPSLIKVENGDEAGVFKGYTNVLTELGTVTHSYSEFEHLTSYDQVETQEEGTYVVYYYSETCSFCQQIKDQVLEFAAGNASNLKVYMLDAKTVPTDDPYDISGTPTMILVEENEFVELIVGAAAIPEFIDEND